MCKKMYNDKIRAINLQIHSLHSERVKGQVTISNAQSITELEEQVRKLIEDRTRVQMELSRPKQIMHHNISKEKGRKSKKFLDYPT